MPQTLGQLKVEVWRRLRRAGVEQPEWETRQLLSLLTGMGQSKLLASESLYLSEKTEERIFELVRQRQEGKPLAYLLGEWDFYGLTLTITPDVLIPRADTEVLCHTAIKMLQAQPLRPRVLDLCCGSGCLGLAIVKEVEDCHVVLVDVSEPALAVARQNRKRVDATRVICMQADALRPPAEHLGQFHVIVCNPPYVTEDEYVFLDASVRDYEPKLALDGGEDGLRFYRAICQSWVSILHPGGALCFEVGWTQADEVLALMRAAGLRDLGELRDSGGRRRVVYGSK